jgi:hypothetical protein
MADGSAAPTPTRAEMVDALHTAFGDHHVSPSAVNATTLVTKGRTKSAT